jgi:hypothetical protein
MSTCTIQFPFHIGDRTSARTTRQATAPLRAAARNHGPTSLAGRTDREASSPASSSPILRRWSIADLIAAASWPRELT